MTRHVHTEDFTEEGTAPVRQLIRTAESLADDLDAKLAAMPPRDEPTPSEYWKGALDTLCFCVLAALIVTICMSFGGPL